MSTRCNTVHPGRAPLPGPPRFTTVVFDMSKTTGKTPGSSRSIRHHPGPSRWTTVQPPVLPGSPRSMDRGEPGSTGSPVGLGHYYHVTNNSLRSEVLREIHFRLTLVSNNVHPQRHNANYVPHSGICVKTVIFIVT